MGVTDATPVSLTDKRESSETSGTAAAAKSVDSLAPNTIPRIEGAILGRRTPPSKIATDSAPV
jgi:hypothetical protein